LRKVIVFAVTAALLTGVAAAVVAQGVTNVELHGYMLNRLYVNPDSSARFVSERVSLSAVGQVGKDGTVYAELYFHPWLPSVTAAEQYRTYLESTYVDLPLWVGRVRVGKGRQLNFGLTPSYPNRKTTQYGIISETFTQDRIVGAQFTFKKDCYDGGVTFYTDTSVGARKIGEFAGVEDAKVVPHLVDKDIPSANTGRLAISGKIGVSKPSYQVHISAASGSLDPASITTINAQLASAFTAKKHNKYGVDATWSSGPYVVQGEWYQGNFSDLQITGWQGLIGYQPKDKTRFYVRYSALNNDISPIAAKLATWNVQQLTIGIVQPIRKGVWLELNYEGNMESVPVGASKVKNDLLFLEVFSGF
jgi:hypothetical protein